MSLILPSRRLAPAWVRNDLWRRARAVPSLDLRFAENKSLVDAISGQNLITFTRSSNGTYVGSDGLLKTATTNEPRFDHNPTTGECLGLLVEEQRVNLLLQSEDFSTTWTNTESSENVNVSVAPSGATVADALVDTTNSAVHAFAQSVAGLAGNASYTFSCYIKKGGKDFGALSFTPNASWGVGTGATAFFNLVNGTVSSTSNATATVQAVGNGWYRCTATATTVASPGTVTLRVCASQNGTALIYAGAGDEALYPWGAQLEAGASPTSYIPTTNSDATRNADVVSITGTNFSSWYNSTQGSIFTEPVFSNTASFNTAYCLGDGTASNRARTVQWNNGGNRPLTVDVGGVSQVGLVGTGGVGSFKFAVGLQADNYAVSQNGANPLVDMLGSMCVADRLFIGSTDGPVFFLNGTLKRFAYWPTRLPNSTLQELTR